ncbi:hypothetical protein pb186bvf_005294 [Paramecium bursaria]
MSANVKETAFFGMADDSIDNIYDKYLNKDKLQCSNKDSFPFNEKSQFTFKYYISLQIQN